MRSSFRADPRTRFLEMYKKWLRQNACNASIAEGELRAFCELTRDIMNHGDLFPSRNHRSFMRTMADVYDHLLWQLKAVLERDRTCAELVQRVLSLSRNLISDSIAFLMLACTVLAQSDALPTLEVVALWQSLPTDSTPLPSRVEPALQKTMRDAWKTRCGSMVASVVCTPWAVRLFDGASAQAEASEVGHKRAQALADAQTADNKKSFKSGSSATVDLIEEVRSEFNQGVFKNSGLAGTLRKPDMEKPRESYLSSIEAVFDLTYLNGEALVQFHRLSNGLGDYGMIRAAPWLHPFLKALTDKVKQLKACQAHVKEVMDKALVLARHKNQKVDAPAPSERMLSRAHAAIARSINGPASHVEKLTAALEELRLRSAPERMPELRGELSDACEQLRAVVESAEYRARVGDCFVAPLTDSPTPSPFAQQLTAEATRPKSLELQWTKPENEEFVSTAESSVSTAASSAEAPIVQEPTVQQASAAVAIRHASVPARVTRPRQRSRPPLPKSIATVAFGRQATPSLPAVPIKALPPLAPARALTALPASSKEPQAAQEDKVDLRAQNPFDDDLSDRGNPFEGSADVPVAVARVVPEANEVELVPEATRTAVPCDAKPSSGADAADAAIVMSEGMISEQSHTTAGGCSSSRSAGAASGGAVSRASSTPLSRRWSAMDAVTSASAALRGMSPAGRRSFSQTRQASVRSGDGTKGDMRVDVWRLGAAYFGQGWRRHDRRSLRIWKGDLHIFGIGSTTLVKTIVDVATDVTSAIVSPGVMSLCLTREAEVDGSTPSSAGAGGSKMYFFEFDSPREAVEFHSELVRIKDAAR
eukprot:TRINITY_DN3535_c0_g1_i2.p1 TRINITY_DN3535_c0_g1~~TRINITY_DN3535_c0_g1_i2.p1  ORF type:complete len:957 (-),score=185.60 TRINITY_DN3535_c0_g1_i2:76-2538(-)